MFAAIRRISRWPLDHKLVMLPALLLMMLLLRLLWGVAVHSQLESQLRGLRVRGEPIDPSQITHQIIPDADNAVPLYRQALKAMVEGIDSPRNSNLEYPDYFPRPADWMKLAQASEKAHAPVFALTRAARQRSRAQFDTSPNDDVDLRYLGDLRNFANTIADSAEYSHLQGNDAEAVERLRDVLHISRTLQADDYLISWLVGVGIEGLACNSTQLIAPDLSVRNVNVRPLIEELLDEKPYGEAQKRKLLNERIRRIHRYTKSAQRDWLLAPLADRDLIRELSSFEIFLQAADSTNFAEAQVILKRRPDDIQQIRARSYGPYFAYIPRYSRWFDVGNDLAPWFDRSYRIIAERRLTAVALACQLYRADHGQFPQSLDQLVPTYLPAIPRDPFFSDGRPIGYAIKTHSPPQTGPRPVLYFDPGGGDFGLKAEPHYSWYAPPVRGAPVRQYRDISRFAPPVLPKTINNNPNISNAPGQN